MKIETMKVLEITEEDLKKLKRKDSPLLACGRLKDEADIIIFKGRVLKNRCGETFMISLNNVLTVSGGPGEDHDK